MDTGCVEELCAKWSEDYDCQSETRNLNVSHYPHGPCACIRGDPLALNELPGAGIYEDLATFFKSIPCFSGPNDSGKIVRSSYSAPSNFAPSVFAPLRFAPCNCVDPPRLSRPKLAFLRLVSVRLTSFKSAP